MTIAPIPNRPTSTIAVDRRASNSHGASTHAASQAKTAGSSCRHAFLAGLRKIRNVIGGVLPRARCEHTTLAHDSPKVTLTRLCYFEGPVFTDEAMPRTGTVAWRSDLFSDASAAASDPDPRPSPQFHPLPSIPALPCAYRSSFDTSTYGAGDSEMREHGADQPLNASVEDVALSGRTSESDSNVCQDTHVPGWRGARSRTIDRDSGFGSSLEVDANPKPEPAATQTPYRWRKADLARARETRWNDSPSERDVESTRIDIPPPPSEHAGDVPMGALRTMIKQKQAAAINARRTPLPRALNKRVSFAPIHPLDRRRSGAKSLRHASSEHDLIGRIKIRVAEQLIRQINEGSRLTPKQIDAMREWIESIIRSASAPEPGSTGDFIESLV